MKNSDLDTAIAAVVADGNCSGCGLCVTLATGYEMRLDAAGFLRPTRAGPTGSRSAADAVVRFERSCPGRRVNAAHPPGARRHPAFGPVVRGFAGWARDPALRYAGASGGVLSALSGWLLSRAADPRVVAAAMDPEEPRRTRTSRIRTPEEVLSHAGSRYAPVANAALAVNLHACDVFVGKPCEVSAVRASGPADDSPLLLSFFCAGTPSQHATNNLVTDLGLAPDEPLTELWYRGRGWPGRFTAVTESGRSVSASYDVAWGESLGRALQWRCRICPDGVGESADLVAADLWERDASGQPDFTEHDGLSALLARTERGAKLLQEALDAGVIDGAELNLSDLEGVQQFQLHRRDSIAARLAGQASTRATIPHFRGFGLLRRTRPRPFVRTLRRARRQYRSVRGPSS